MERALLPQMVATLLIQTSIDCYIKIFRHSVSNRYGTSISEAGEEALDQAKELVEARSKS